MPKRRQEPPLSVFNPQNHQEHSKGMNILLNNTHSGQKIRNIVNWEAEWKREHNPRHKFSQLYRAVNLRQRLIKCQLCYELFYNQKSLDRHRKLCNKEGPLFKPNQLRAYGEKFFCYCCDKFTGTQKRVLKHMVATHSRGSMEVWGLHKEQIALFLFNRAYRKMNKRQEKTLEKERRSSKADAFDLELEDLFNQKYSKRESDLESTETSQNQMPSQLDQNQLESVQRLSVLLEYDDEDMEHPLRWIEREWIRNRPLQCTIMVLGSNGRIQKYQVINLDANQPINLNEYHLKFYKRVGQHTQAQAQVKNTFSNNFTFLTDTQRPQSKILVEDKNPTALISPAILEKQTTDKQYSRASIFDVIKTMIKTPKLESKYWGKDTYKPEKPTILIQDWYIIRVKCGPHLNRDQVHDIYLLYTQTSQAIKNPFIKRFAPDVIEIWMDCEILAIAMKLPPGSINIADAVQKKRKECFWYLNDLMNQVLRLWVNCAIKDLNMENVYYCIASKKWTFVNWKFAEIFPQQRPQQSNIELDRIFKQSDQSVTLAGYNQNWNDIYNLGWFILDISYYLHKNGQIAWSELPSRSIKNSTQQNLFLDLQLDISDFRYPYSTVGQVDTLTENISIQKLIFLVMQVGCSDSDQFQKFCCGIFELLNNPKEYHFTLKKSIRHREGNPEKSCLKTSPVHNKKKVSFSEKQEIGYIERRIPVANEKDQEAQFEI